MTSLKVNGKTYRVDAPTDTPLLWVLREHLNLKGTKYGCGIGECGSCIVHIDGVAERSCTIMLDEIEEKEITTIEGLAEDHPVKRAWIEEQVPQCGYCQSGQMMQAAELLNDEAKPDDKQIIAYMDDVLCRCGTYPLIKKAIKTATRYQSEEG